MKSISLVLFISLLVAANIPLHAQGVQPVSRGKFDEAVRSVLQKFEGAEFRYNNSEAYHRYINYKVRKELGLINESK